MWRILLCSCILTSVLARPGTDLVAKSEKPRQIIRDFKQIISREMTNPTASENYPKEGIIKTLLSEYNQSGQENVVKAKLFKMLLESKKDIDKKCDLTDKLHDYLKSSKAYELGFMVGHLRTTYELLTDLYQDARKNFHEWVILKILYAYEQTRKTERVLDETMAALKTAVAMYMPNELKAKPGTEGKRISWDYYDES